MRLGLLSLARTRYVDVVDAGRSASSSAWIDVRQTALYKTRAAIETRSLEVWHTLAQPNSLDSLALLLFCTAAFVRRRSEQPSRLAPSRVPHIASPLPGKFSESRAIYLFPPV
jgi:hypothetical protein